MNAQATTREYVIVLADKLGIRYEDELAEVVTRLSNGDIATVRSRVSSLH